MSTQPPVERVIQLTSQGLRISRADLPEIEEFARTRISELIRVGIDANTLARLKYKLDRLDRFTQDGADKEIRNASIVQCKTVLAQLAPFITSESRQAMELHNPLYIPRQSYIQDAIDSVQADHSSQSVQRLLEVVLAPFERKGNCENYEAPNFSFSGTCLSCSS